MFEFILGLCILFIAEYIGDFLLQSRKMALNKSKDGSYLREHLVRISLILSLAAVILKLSSFGAASIAIICLIIPNAICHGIQDWYIWNGYKKIVAKKEKDIERFVKERLYAEDKLFYDFIGLDRLLHILTMTILYSLFFTGV